MEVDRGAGHWPEGLPRLLQFLSEKTMGVAEKTDRWVVGVGVWEAWRGVGAWKKQALNCESELAEGW